MLIAICEDTPQDMEVILDLCDAYAGERGYKLHTLTYSHADKLLADEVARTADIMLLDIMMPGDGGSRAYGVELARRIRAEKYAGAIIFLTSSNEYYGEGFEVAAAHYILKPLRREDFFTAMDRAMRQVQPPERMITVPVNRIQLTMAQSVIRYAEVYGRETVLHTTTEPVRVLLPLKRIEELLHGDPFLRCYRSYIINMDYVESLQEDCFVLQGGVRIPITLRSRQALRERFFNYRLTKVK